MNFIKNIAECGLRVEDPYAIKRGVLLTNYISMTLSAVMVLLIVVRGGIYHNLTNPEQQAVGLALFLIPIGLNRISLRDFSQLYLAIVPTLFIWVVFVTEMKKFDEVPGSFYAGMRVYLLAVSSIPYLVLTRPRWQLLIVGILPSTISILFFENILRWLEVGYTVTPGTDFELMNLRFVVAYMVIGVSCYLLQSVIIKSDELNHGLIGALKEKKNEVEDRNRELIESRNQLDKSNKHLEELLVERGRKIYEQQSSIVSFAYANAHQIRGPLARLMGLVELSKIDPQMDNKWLLSTIEHEAKDLDATIRKISSELGHKPQ